MIGPCSRSISSRRSHQGVYQILATSSATRRRELSSRVRATRRVLSFSPYTIDLPRPGTRVGGQGWAAGGRVGNAARRPTSAVRPGAPGAPAAGRLRARTRPPHTCSGASCVRAQGRVLHHCLSGMRWPTHCRARGGSLASRAVHFSSTSCLLHPLEPLRAGVPVPGTPWVAINSSPPWAKAAWAESGLRARWARPCSAWWR